MVTLSPSFVPPFMSFMPPFMPRLLTRVPPLLSDSVSCDRGRRRPSRCDIWRFRRQRWSGHWRRCKEEEPAAVFGCMRRRAPRQTRSSAVWRLDQRSLLNRAATTSIRIAWPCSTERGNIFPLRHSRAGSPADGYRSGPVANSGVGRTMGCARPRFDTLLAAGKPVVTDKHPGPLAYRPGACKAEAFSQPQHGLEPPDCPSCRGKDWKPPILGHRSFALGSDRSRSPAAGAG